MQSHSNGLYKNCVLLVVLFIATLRIAQLIKTTIISVRKVMLQMAGERTVVV